MQLNDPKLFRQQAYIDGDWVDSDNGQALKVNNPATGEIIGRVPKMGALQLAAQAITKHATRTAPTPQHSTMMAATLPALPVPVA